MNIFDVQKRYGDEVGLVVGGEFGESMNTRVTGMEQVGDVHTNARVRKM